MTTPANVRPNRKRSDPGPEVTYVADDVSYTLRQIGWHGQSGAFYALDEEPSLAEPGSFTPLYFVAHADPVGAK